MARKDYEEIKTGFEQFLNAWSSRDVKILDECFMKETKCYLSVVEKYPCGSQHGICGVKDFVSDSNEIPDFFNIIPCNFVARLSGNMARQSATAVCRVGKYEENEVKILEFSALFANQWKKTDSGWKICEMKMDVVECSGDYTEFIDKWYFEKKDLKYYFGIHLPTILGELDNPWSDALQAEEVLNDEEQILETFSRYAFGIDTLDFTQLTPALSDDLVVNMAPWGAMDKREFMNTLKYKRMASRHWNHPALLDSVEINGDEADLRLYRMAGHKQSDHPVILTKENAETMYACARYEIKMQKENNRWRILRMDYYLGTIFL